MRLDKVRPVDDREVSQRAKRHAACASFGFTAIALVFGTLACFPAAGAEGPALRGLQPPRMSLSFESSRERWNDPLVQWQSDTERSSFADDTRRLYGFRIPMRLADVPTSGTAKWQYSLREQFNTSAVGLTSPVYGLVPRYAVGGQAVKSFASGWDIGLGLRQKNYGSTNISVMALGAQRQWGPIRGAYTLYSGYGDTSAPVPSQRIQLMYDYGNRSTIGLSYTAGKELEPGFAPLALTPIDVRDLSLSGNHWLAPQWAFTYNLSNYETSSYRRQGLRLGIRHTF